MIVNGERSMRSKRLGDVVRGIVDRVAADRRRAVLPSRVLAKRGELGQRSEPRVLTPMSNSIATAATHG